MVGVVVVFTKTLHFLLLTCVQGTGTSAEPCSFKRFPAKELMDENFGGKPKWLRLQEDKVGAARVPSHRAASRRIMLCPVAEYERMYEPLWVSVFFFPLTYASVDLISYVQQ